MFPDNDRFESMFTLENEKNGVIEEKTFRILVLGDWSGDSEKVEFKNRPIIEIDRDNFDSALNRCKPNLQLNLSETADEITSLDFTELDDFHPDNIFRQVPLFTELRSLRRRLSDPATFNSAAHEVRGWISDRQIEPTDENSELPQSVQSDELLDQILSGKSEAVRLQKADSSELSSLLKDLVRPFLIGFDENEQKSLISLVDNATGELMRKIIHHQKFQNLEAAWRSLYFLIRNAETDSSLKIYFLNISKEELIAKLKDNNNLTETEVFRKIVVEANSLFDDDTFSVFVGNYEFDSELDDVASLIRLSKIGASINCPFISKMSPKLLDFDSFVDASDSSGWTISEDSRQGKLWATLRSLPESEFLGMTLNRFLLRLPFGSESDQIDSFAFEEFGDKPLHNN
ncbi:MAG TPA: type VI secretion system contractile sheath large subunit, partial [Pyrinomonadaceae bacterium]|nr:type VI secretion system contractile sheath large subunit [Pyrinomonadaceae bacterium]